MEDEARERMLMLFSQLSEEQKDRFIDYLLEIQGIAEPVLAALA